MARVAGVDLPKHKQAWVALAHIYGVGRPLGLKICADTGINPQTRVKDLTESEISRLNSEISAKYKVEGDLRRELHQNLRRLVDIRSYRGLRHLRNLPVRGQRTRTNARTRRGKRKTVGAVRKVETAAPAKGEAKGAKE